MRHTEAERIRADIGTIERFISETISEQMSWESQLRALRERLAEVEEQRAAMTQDKTEKGGAK